ncbi:MAG: hypothetical protein ACRDUX_02425, partial [Mycobacterium sp.]
MTELAVRVGELPVDAARVADARRQRMVPSHDLENSALVSAVLGLLSFAPLPAGVRAILLAVFILTGPGLALVSWVRLPLPASVAAVPVTGLSVMAGSTAAMAWAKVWFPGPLAMTLIGAVTISALVRRRRARDGGSASALTFSALAKWLDRLKPDRVL